MATKAFTINAPNGRTYTVNAPEDTEQEELFRYVQSQIALSGTGAPEGPVGSAAPIEYGTEASYKSENAPWYQDVADVGVGFTSGVSKAAGAIVGLGSYVPGLNKIADPAAAALQDFGEYIDDSLLSDRQKEINQELNIRIQEVVGSLPADASMDDYLEALKAGGGEAWEYFKDHKMQVVNLIAASAPYILGGGVITKGLKGAADVAGLSKVAAIAKPGQAVSKTLKNPIIGGAVGEASIVGGQVVTDVIDETDSVGKYSADRLKAAGTIPTTGIISLLGGRATKGLKGVDVDTAFTGKIVSGTDLLGTNTSKGLINTTYKTGVGLVVEGAEETAQSGLEKYWENYGVDKGYDMLSPKLLRGVGEEAVMGGITGAGQGAGVNALSSIRGKTDSLDKIVDDVEINELEKELDAQENKDTAEIAQENLVQEQLFESNDDMLNETLRLIEGLAIGDQEVASNIESPLDKALYYLEVLKTSPAQEFNTGRNKTNSANVINGLEMSIEALAPGTLAEIAIKDTKDKRRTYAASFPNEKEWKNEAKKDDFLQQRIQISNPTSDIGIDFREWQDNDEIVIEGKFDTDPSGLPTEAAVKSFLGQQEIDVGSADYQQALDDHAQLQEEKATRTVEDQQMIDQNLASLVARRKEALASGNFEDLASIENEAANTIEFTAEWAAAKREADKKPAKQAKAEVVEEVDEKTAGDQEGQDLFDAIEAEALANQDGTNYLGIQDGAPEEKVVKKAKPKKTATGSGVAAPRGEELAEEITEAETIEDDTTEVNPFREFNDKEGKKPNKKHIRYKTVADDIGYGFENNDTSEVFKKVYDAIDKSVSDQRLTNLMREVADLQEANAIEDPRMRLVQVRRIGKWQQAVIPFLMDASRRGNLDEYRTWNPNAINTRAEPLVEGTYNVPVVTDEQIAENKKKAKPKKVLVDTNRGLADNEFTVAESIGATTNQTETVSGLISPKYELEYETETGEEGPVQPRGAYEWYNQAIGEAIEKKAGITLSTAELRNAGKRVNDALNRYMQRQVELGEISEVREKRIEFSERLDNKWLEKIMSQAAVDNTSVIDSSTVARELDPDLNDSEGVTFGDNVNDVLALGGSRTMQTQAEQIEIAAAAAAAADTDASVSSAGGTQINDASTTKDMQDYVDQNANKADVKQVERVQTAQMEALQYVDSEHKNKGTKKAAIKLWDDQNLARGAPINGEGNNLTELGYLDQPAEVQKSWLNAITISESKGVDILPEYFEDIIYAHSDRIESNIKLKQERTERKAKETKSKKKVKKKSDNVKALGTASQTKVAEIQAKRQAVRAEKKQKDEAAAAEKKRKAQERKDAKNAKVKEKRQAAQTEKNKTERRAREAEENEQSNSSATTESKTEVKKSSSESGAKQRTGASNNESGRRNNKTVRKKQQAIIATGNAEGIVTGNSASADTFDGFFRDMLGVKELKRIKNRIFYFETEEAAIQAGYDPDGGSAYVGTVRGPKGERITGKPDIMVFILDKISEGREGALFMHEVGGHIGLDNILTTNERRGLESKIDNWYAEDYAKYGNESWYNDSLEDVIAAKRPAQSPERLMARYAIRNAANEAYQDDTGKVPTDTATSEKIAFFLEAATDIGVKPSEQTETGKLLNKFKQALVKFLRDVGIFSRVGVTSSLSINAQDIVNLAYGAAKVELERGFRFGRKPPSQRLFDNVGKTFAKQATEPSKWDAEIEAEARIKFPKNDKNKYIAPGFLAKEEWRQFQISQGRAEKQFKVGKKAYVTKMLKEAAENEANMSDPEGNKYNKKFSKKQKAIIKKDANEIDNAVKENYPDNTAQWEIFKGMAGQASKGLVFKYDFINRFKDRLPSLQEAQDVIDQSNMLSRSLKKMVDDIVVRRRGMKKDRVVLINRMIELGTSRQVWPADLNYLKDENDNTNYQDVEVNKAFSELFKKKLNAKEQALVMDVFRHGEKTMMMKRAIVELLGLPTDVFGVTSLKGPYAPLRRTGKHIVVLKSKELQDAENKLKEEDVPSYVRKQTTAKIQKLKDSSDHFVYRHFLNAGAAKGFRNEQSATGNWATTRYTVKPTVIGEGSSDYGVLQKVFSQLENSGVIPSISSDKATQNLLRSAFKDMLNRMYAESLEETSARQGQQRRQGKGIAGFDQDMLASFASNGRSEASIIANMRYGQEIAVALGKVRKEAETIDSETNDPDAEMMKVYNMMAFHYNSMLNKKAKPFTDGIASTVTAWFLTTSLSYHLQNATQTIAVAVPIVAADFGNYTQTMNELTKGYAVAHDMISYDKKIPFIGSKEATWTVNIDLTKAPPELRDLLTNLDQKEILDLGIEQDLAETNAAETGFQTVDTILKASGSMSHKLYQVPRGVEGYNRIATAVMAYNMAVKNPKVMKTLKTNPIDYATKKVQDTQGDFTADGAPAAFKWVMDNVPAGKLVVQYKKFPLLMAMNYLRSFNMIVSKDTSMQERIIGFRALRNLLAHTAVLSGLRGLPLVANGLMVASMYLALFGDDEDKLEPNQTEGALERKIDSMFPDNPEFAQMLYRGVGPSFLGVDLSMKLSHGSVFQLMPFTDFELSEAGFKDLGLGFFGASGSAALNIFKGGQFITEGNYYRGIESMMPKGIKDPMEAWRFMSQGYTTRAGDLKVPPGDFKTMELVFKALGIPGKEITKMKWKSSEQFQIKEFFNKKQRKLKREYLKADKANDYQTMDKLIDQWMILQDNKDAVRSFFNDAVSAIPRTSVGTLTNAVENQVVNERKLQDQAASGDYRKN